MLDLIGDNIWQTTGELPGPTLCVLGGVHGNELTGIEVVKRICADFASSARGLQSGRLIMAFGNPLAIEQGTRFVDGRDLNRYFTDTHLLGILDGSIEESRAKELAQVIQQSDITVDIHSTNKPSMPFISSRVDSEHLQVYQWFNASVVLADPNYVLAGEPATTDEYADRMGRVGVCVEAGDAKDVTRITSVLQSINGLMTHMGLVNEPGGEHFTGHQVFTLCDSIVCGYTKRVYV